MNFKFTDEQLSMKKMVHDFAEKEISPLIGKMEAGWFPREILKKMAALGLMGITVPEKYGGAGLDFTSCILAVHELSKVSAAIGVILSVHSSVGTNPILYFGSEEQKARYLPKLAGGKYLGAFCLTEANAGSDAGSLGTRAEKQGDAYILNGSKMFVTNGGEADTYIVFAKTEGGQITAFIVEKGAAGFRIGKDEKKMGLHGSRTVQLHFENMPVPAQNRIGAEGQGFKIAMSNLDAGRIGIAAQALGIAEGAYEKALKYAKTRRQFGCPIHEFQGTGFKLADMAAKIEASKLLVYQACDLKNRGLDCRKEAAMAKLLASQTAVDTAAEALQIFGGYGYMEDYPIERYFRDAKITQIYEGTSEVQKIVISNQLLR
ncbi:acyl-CoA dehydrogenase [Heyndrickxia acidiproducens]|jgi:alkylation response protein AidB-like acyl-CoA dehydrogenase|uniref:acyl-CoA dehydrogenase n=1 Tax=Heyndrickxia acidiproducens TaxID=1121084 RepID=UPI00037E16DD|nr:acyl-CoA dehydrogenase [Heyndrickxia acidiproducens]